jgi:hypothetical protein
MTIRERDERVDRGGEARPRRLPCLSETLAGLFSIAFLTHRGLGSFAVVLLLGGMAFGQHPHSAPPPPAPHYSTPAPRASAQPGGQSNSSGRQNYQNHPPGQQHLNEWMQRNRGLSPQEQVQRLRQEQGFSRLPPQQQQRLTNRLQQLNQMPPEQRQRTLERMENMERLSPDARQQVRGSAAMLGQMPPQRQQAVRQAMRELRNIPPEMRQSELNSPRYAGQLSPQERGIVGSLLTVEPYHAAPLPPR